MTEIITSDLVPLGERGVYQGILGLTWSFASGIGPPIVSLAFSIFRRLPMNTKNRVGLLPRGHHGAGCFVSDLNS